MDRWYTRFEIAEMLGVDPQTVYRWMKAGKLAYSQPSPRVIRISEDSLKVFLGTKESRFSTYGHK